MSKILSQDEIDSLLSTAPGGDGRPGQCPTSASVVTYNFRRPDRVFEGPDPIAAFSARPVRQERDHLAHAAYLRALVEFSIVSVEQFSYRVPDVAVGSDGLLRDLDGAARRHGRARIESDRRLTMVDRMLGGSGRGRRRSGR
jgi:flagellar motor switch protein FliM